MVQARYAEARKSCEQMAALTSDLVAVIACVVKLSRRSNIKEIDLPAMMDEMV